MKCKSLVAVLFFITLQSVACSNQPKQSNQLDIKKSKILWNTGKMMGGHFGYILFKSGSLQYSPAGKPVSGSFIIDMNQIHSTDIKEETARLKKDGEIRSPDFLAAGQFPTATVNVKKITQVGSSSAFQVNADLTIKGITNPIDFLANIETKADSTYITGNVDIHRYLWNIHSKPEVNKTAFITTIKEAVAPDIHVTLDLVIAR